MTSTDEGQCRSRVKHPLQRRRRRYQAGQRGQRRRRGNFHKVRRRSDGYWHGGKSMLHWLRVGHATEKQALVIYTDERNRLRVPERSREGASAAGGIHLGDTRFLHTVQQGGCKSWERTVGRSLGAHGAHGDNGRPAAESLHRWCGRARAGASLAFAFARSRTVASTGRGRRGIRPAREGGFSCRLSCLVAIPALSPKTTRPS